MHTQAELLALVTEYHAGFQVDIKDLPSTIVSLMQNSDKADGVRKGGERLIQRDERGHTENLGGITNSNDKVLRK